MIFIEKLIVKEILKNSLKNLITYEKEILNKKKNKKYINYKLVEYLEKEMKQLTTITLEESKEFLSSSIYINGKDMPTTNLVAITLKHDELDINDINKIIAMKREPYEYKHSLGIEWNKKFIYIFFCEDGNNMKKIKFCKENKIFL
ncbi:hypothetical protein SAMN02745174_01844 [Cetobacterium ceti]|uniref:Uncharacterized protein n=1 Tax=Cetobacterium ceti TaxID=180163 RepID=A0A1T4PA65_9FUSO|nr:hypothetical protein SAMN02745174_01844 [Cetobacterium ceti]